MAKVSKVPAFKPAKIKSTPPMVVVTVRLPATTRDKIRLLFRTSAEFNSISHVIQQAVEEFVDQHAR